MIQRRRLLMPLLPAVTGAWVWPRRAAGREPDVTFKMAHSAPPAHPLHLRLLEAGQRIHADSDGRAACQVFPADQLGAQPDGLNQVRQGAVDFVAVPGLVLSRLVPASAISGLGFAFKDMASVWKCMDGELGAFVRAEIEKTGTLFAFERMFDNGLRQLTTATRPVLSPQDLQGLKLRVPPSAVWVSLFKALGASPTVVNTAEMYAALQTRLVDGQENPLALVWSFNLYEVQKYCSVTNHMWDGFWLVGNRANFERLPAELRAIITRHLSSAALAERADVAQLEAASRGLLMQKGMQFVDLPAGPFIDRLRAAGFYAEWKARLPAAGWARLEAVVGPL